MEHEHDEYDCFITPCGTLGSKLSVSINQQYLGEYPEMQDAEFAIVQWMQVNSYWPDVWFVDDHGGVTQHKIIDVRYCDECERIEIK